MTGAARSLAGERVPAVRRRAVSVGRLAGEALLWAGVALVLVFVLFPFYGMLNTSLKPNAEVFAWPPSFWSPNWSFAPWVRMWTTRPFGQYFLNSAIVSGGSTLIAVALSALAAYGLSRFPLRLERPLIIFLLLTQMLPGTLLIIPYFQLMARAGLINNYLALILAYVSFALPFATWLLIGYFRSIPRELDEAAMVDGCTRLGAFRRIVLPLAAPGLVAVAIYTCLLAWNAYVFALVLTTDPKFFPSRSASRI